MLIIEEINRYDDVLGLKDQWNRIIDEAGLDISLRFDFSASLWDAHLDKKDIVLLLVKEEGEIVGIFPLVISKKKILKIFPITSVGLLSNIFCFHNNFICKADTENCFKEVLKYLTEHYPNWNIFEVMNVPEDSNVNMLSLTLGNKYCLWYKRAGAPFISLLKTWDEYLLTRSKKFRKDIRNKGKGLEKSGQVFFRDYFGVKLGDLILPMIHEVEKESWKENAGISIAADEKQEKLYESLLGNLNFHNNFFASFLFFGQECAAFRLGIIDKNKVYTLKSAYKIKFSDYSPGFLLARHNIETFFEKGFKESDMLTGNPPWKQEWATGVRLEYVLQLYNSKSLYSKWLYFLSNIVGRLTNKTCMPRFFEAKNKDVAIEAICGFAQAQVLKDQWDRIVDEAGLDISLSFDFSTSLWDAHLDKKDILILLAKEGNEIVGIFPLVISRKMVLRFFPVVSIGPLSNIFCFHNDFICKKDVERCFKAVMKYLDEHYPNWDIFEIENISKDSNIMTMLTQGGFKTLSLFECEDAPYVRLNGSWEKYASERPGNFKHKLNKDSKKFESINGHKILELSLHDGIEYILDNIYEIERESWKEKAHVSIALNEKQKKFYESFLKKEAARSYFKALFLEIGDECIAFMIIIMHKKICYLLKLAYKEKYKNLSTGLNMHKYLIKRLFDMECIEYDMLLGDHSWKQEWATDVRETFHSRIYNNNRFYSKFVYYLKRWVSLFRRWK